MNRGLTHWFWQRATALALIPALLVVAWLVICAPDWSPASSIEFLARPSIAWTIGLVSAVAYGHAGLGMHTIIEDYIAHPSGQKLLIGLVNIGLIGAWLAVVVSLYQLA